MIGSPPLTRERPSYVTTVWVVKRITPAYAGKTCLVVAFLASSQDHPRLRGKDLS